ncbi:MAG: ribonuclease HII [Winogradskyella sp.]|nr:ribonuclease HII [Winogradskyella sp.]
MKKHLLYIIILVSFSCSERYKTKTDVSEIIPSSHHTIIKVNAFSDLKAISQKNIPFKEFKIKDLLSKAEFLNTTKPIYFSISDNNYTFITEYSKSLLQVDSISDILSKKILDNDVIKTVNNKDTLYHKIINGFFFGSENYKLVDTIKKKSNSQLKKLLTTIDSKAEASIIFKNKSDNDLILKRNTLKNSTEYEVLDLNMEGDDISYSGFVRNNDTLFRKNVFRNTIPQEFDLANIIPKDVESFTRIAFDDYLIFSENISKLNATEKDSTSDILNLSNEVSVIKTKFGEAITIGTLDENLLEEVVSEELNANSEAFKDVPIFKFEKDSIFRDRFLPFFSLEKASLGFVYGNFAVFSNDKKTLQHIISQKVNNQTLATSEKFKDISMQLADESSYLIYKNGEGLYDFLNRPAKGYNANAVQYVYETNFAHINGILSKYKKRPSGNSITDDFTISLTSEILMQPQTVKNHRNNSYEIVVQDVLNNLYLISNSGQILWKRKLEGGILGKVKQIDIYKNGRLQLAFATPNYVYIIDRNGKDVGPFPKKFNDNITKPLSVFDYDNRKNYRLLVTQNKSLIMYNTEAKRVNGFKYKKASNTISSQPKHFKIGSKDYIVFSQGEKLEVLNRQGKERITVKGNIEFSNNSIYLYQNKFTTLTNTGQLAQVDTDGYINLKPFDLDTNSNINTTSKTLVAMSDNKLKIKSKILDLDFGNYTMPRIFYLYDKIYISTTDLDAKKVFIYDSQGKLLPNFPVFGTASIDLQNLDKKRGLELITQSDNKTIIVYKIN